MLALLAAVALFGADWPAMRLLLGVLSPVAMLTLMFFGAALSAVVTCFFLGEAPQRGSPVLKACALGVLSPGLNYGLAVSGLAMTNASVTSIASGTEPIAIVVLSALLLRERFDRRVWIPLGFTVAGLLAVSFRATTLDPMWGTGTLLVSAGTLCGAVYIILQRGDRSMRTPHSLAWQLSAGFASTLSLAFLLSPSVFESLRHASALIVLLALLFGVVFVHLPFLALTFASGYLRGQTIGITFALMPAVGVAIAMGLLNERPSLAQILGATAIIAAVIAYEWQVLRPSPRRLSTK
ncbi:MAG: DMT family transporter [Candidatus Eremiobacteraeota bacterium]|nr:DMT family transporter [Candidatus Eremiobacteraeota bacterium]